MSTTELRCFLKWIRSVWASALVSTTIILELRSFFHAEALAWKKFITASSFLGTIFGFLGLLSNASVEENKYQIVQYNQCKAFIKSAVEEILRIQKIKTQINEKELQSEINYLRFLEQQIKMINREIELNKASDLQQEAEILYNFSKYNTHRVVYKDTRLEKSPDSYHNIGYHKLFEE